MSELREIELDAHDPEGWGEGLRLGRRALTSGEILVHPTATVYGLGAKASRTLDVEINRLKGRPPTDPLIRLAGDVEVIRSMLPDSAWSEVADRLAERFWPGALTLVLDDGSATGIAVRVDGHPFLLRLLEPWPSLMTSTSLNAHGEPAAATPAEVRETLAGMTDANVPITFLSLGTLSPSRPSTIVSLRSGTPEVLREGPIDAPAIAACVAEGT